MAGSPRSVLASEGGGLTAVVLGAGVAGLLSAHAACKHFDRVLLIEADRLEPADRGAEILQAAKQRRGIPQYCEPHTLAMGGLEAMEALMPGFHAELVRRGGVELDLARDFRIFDFGAPYVRWEPSSLKSVGASRHLIQATLQDEVLRRNADKLEVMDGCRVADLVWSADRSTVLGVELNDGVQVDGDLVLVAMGRKCRLPQWFKAAGYQQPPVQRVDAQLSYVSRMYRIPPEWDRRWLGSVIFGRPSGLRGAGIVPVEGDTWQVVAWGLNGVMPPMDEAGFLEYVRTLPDDQIYQAISAAEPKTPFLKYAGAYNIQRGWHKVPLPAGLVVLGDAAQALNPVYAQGMSVAAKSVEALQRSLFTALAAAGSSTEAQRAAVHKMGPAFQRQLASVVEAAWMMATSEDLRYPGTVSEGVSKPPRLLAAYIDALLKACHHDAKVFETFFLIAHMVRPPIYMLHPRLVAAGVWEMLLEAAGAWWPASNKVEKKTV